MQIGAVVADKFEVTSVLGKGGMGTVVAARHRELDKLVALKFMHDELATDPRAIERFLREARAASQLRSEHVGRVLDVGRLASGVPYIVMELLEGRDLGQLLDACGVLPASDAVGYLLHVCEAMAEAHALGIVHRDLKPQNLMVTVRPDGMPLVKVLDFGISKARFAEGATRTQTAMGTPAYMAPEQMRSARTVDARADIWSLGVILYQLLSNALPFVGDTFAETMLKVLSDPPIALGALRRDVPPALIAAIDRCLQKDRERRFATVAELAQALAPFAPPWARATVVPAGLVPTLPPPPPIDTHGAPAPTTLGSSAAASFAPPRTGSRAGLIAALVGSVAVAVALTVVLTRRPAAVVPDAPPPPVAVHEVAPDATLVAVTVPDADISDAAHPPDAARPPDASPVSTPRTESTPKSKPDPRPPPPDAALPPPDDFIVVDPRLPGAP